MNFYFYYNFNARAGFKLFIKKNNKHLEMKSFKEDNNIAIQSALSLSKVF